MGSTLDSRRSAGFVLKDGINRDDVLVAAPGDNASCHENEMKRYEKPGTCRKKRLRVNLRRVSHSGPPKVFNLQLAAAVAAFSIDMTLVRQPR